MGILAANRPEACAESLRLVGGDHERVGNPERDSRSCRDEEQVAFATAEIVTIDLGIDAPLSQRSVEASFEFDEPVELGKPDTPLQDEQVTRAQLPKTMPARESHSEMGPGTMPNATVAMAETTSATSVVQ